jgi:hypothetical protein
LFWGLRPPAPGIFRFDAIPDNRFLLLGPGLKVSPSLVWPRSRRSGCFPASPYPPLRPLVVYSQMTEEFNGGTKKSLIVAALSDMVNIVP